VLHLQQLMTSSRQHFAALLVALAVGASAIIVMRVLSRPAGPALIVDRELGEVRIRATVHPGAMHRPFGVKGHHAIVWDRGRAAGWALFRSQASDREVRMALQNLGARPGENLTLDSWNRRSDRSSPEPDKRVEGTPIDVFVTWAGTETRLPLASVISERGMSRPAFDFRYGGNERWQPAFKSGCIVCLYSCPGGAIGNHAHPLRDYVRDGVVYASVPERLPERGSEVTIILRPRLEGP
jgi:hypothetical protein